MPRLFQQDDLVAIPSNARQVVSSPEVSSTTSASFVEMKGWVVPHPGMYRFKYSVRLYGTVQVWDTELRVNDVREGKPRTSSSMAWVEYTEDLGQLKKDDKVSVYGRIFSNSTLEVTNFIVLAEYSYRFPAIDPGKITKAS